MDNSSVCGTSHSGSEMSKAVNSRNASIGDDSTIDKISTGLSGELNISDGNSTRTAQRIPVERYYVEEEEEEEEEEEDDLSEAALLAQMGYAESESKEGYEDEEEEEEEADLSEDSVLAQMGYLKNEPPKHEPIMTPISNLNLVSVLKGSREKEGKPPKDCRVTWSPDVYDPPCTSDDHYAPTKTERHRSEVKAKGLAGKNRQKCGGKGVGAIEGGGKGSKSVGNKGGAGGGKVAGKIKDKKKADKKSKKRGGTASKYSDHDED